MAQYYTLDGAIQSFFESSTSVTRQECDDFVEARFNGKPQPVEMQVANSYTVAAGQDGCRIIQFREYISLLPMERWNTVQEAASGFVADVKYLGTIGDDRPLHRYDMNKIPGQV